MSHPYGTWRSPLTASAIASQSIGLGSVSVDQDEIYWLEARPQENGRSVLVRLSTDGATADVTGPGTNVRTRVHEYGGGAHVVHAGEVFYVNFADQRVYRRKRDADALPITAEGPVRYADFAVDSARRRLICVREDHSAGGEPVNSLVSLAMDVGHEGGEVNVLAFGHDFYSTPQVSADGRRLAWLAWRHPNMPWDGTELWVATIAADGALEASQMVAGGDTDSIYQPGWSPDGSLYFVSDRDGWWRFYRLTSERLNELGSSDRGTARAESVIHVPPPETEFGRPQWVLGSTTWMFVDPSTLLTVFARDGRSGLALVDVRAGTCTDVATDLEPLDNLAVTGREVVFMGGSATNLPALVRMSLDTGDVSTLRASSSVVLDPALVSRAESIMFPTENGLLAHAFFYPPKNSNYKADPDQRPPLIVISHGGPTDAARSSLRLATQYWTTRGFAIVDVNYGGSTGFGRAYRERLNGQWGVVDVADCVNAARYLVAQGRVDPDRLIVRGGSAGGYTTLAALAFHPGVFKAAASYYGICDLEVLAHDTHKFESRYTDGLVGPYPAARDVYRARSPIHAVDRLSCPLILFHGSEDKVVPPNQAELMADALRAKGLPVALVIFAGEQHGFRKSASLIRSLEAELWFYGAVFGFAPADTIEPVGIRG